MKILVPVISGKEKNDAFISKVLLEGKEIVLLQIVDEEFHSKAGSAIGEVRNLRIAIDEIKKAAGAKKKKCIELTQWGSTVTKIVSIAILQKVDKVVLVKQENQFFEDIINELKKNKIKFDAVEVVEEFVEKKRMGGFFGRKK